MHAFLTTYFNFGWNRMQQLALLKASPWVNLRPTHAQFTLFNVYVSSVITQLVLNAELSINLLLYITKMLLVVLWKTEIFIQHDALLCDRTIAFVRNTSERSQAGWTLAFVWTNVSDKFCWSDCRKSVKWRMFGFLKQIEDCIWKGEQCWHMPIGRCGKL
jgi:hypothetical protein